MKGNRYPFSIEWSEEDREYIATCPAFPGLSAFGETEEGALNEAKIALTGFIESYKANNMALPEPGVREALSGKFQLRLPKSLHSLAVRMAHREGVSLNSYIVDSVRAKVVGDQVGNRVLNEVRQLLAQTQDSDTTAGNPSTTKRTEKPTLTEKTAFITKRDKQATGKATLLKPGKATKSTRNKRRYPHSSSFRKA